MTVPEWAILLYPILMMSALATGVWLKGRQKPDPRLSPFESLWIGLGAFIGAMVMAKLPFVLLDPDGMRDGSVFFMSGKTILFGLVTEGLLSCCGLHGPWELQTVFVESLVRRR